MVPLKLVYKEDIRKITVESVTIGALYTTIQSLFLELAGVSFDTLFLHYFDTEDDKIRIKTDSDLQEALKCHKDNVLKIFVQTNGSPLSSPPADLTSSFSTTLQSNPTTSPSNSNDNTSSWNPNLFPLLGMLSGMFTGSFSSTAAQTSSATTSNSTNTASAKDASTEPAVFNVSSQTTQTQSNPSQTTQTSIPTISTHTTQTASHVPISTQTHYTPSGVQTPQATQTTQTHVVPSATQTTQTATHVPISTQTQFVPSTTQMTQTQTVTQTPVTTQTQEHVMQQWIQTQSTPVATEPPQEQIPQVESQKDTFEFLSGTRFGKLLEQLMELGFTDKEECVRVLVKHGGNMEETVDELLK